jgi:diaminopimelate decarboxylase
VLPADHPPAPPADLNALHPAVWPRGAQRQGGVLTLGGIDARDLAARFGTPVLVTDEADVRSRAREYARLRTSPTRPRRSAHGRCCAG